MTNSKIITENRLFHELSSMYFILLSSIKRINYYIRPYIGLTE